MTPSNTKHCWVFESSSKVITSNIKHCWLFQHSSKVTTSNTEHLFHDKGEREFYDPYAANLNPTWSAWKPISRCRLDPRGRLICMLRETVTEFHPSSQNRANQELLSFTATIRITKKSLQILWSFLETEWRFRLCLTKDYTVVLKFDGISICWLAFIFVQIRSVRPDRNILGNALSFKWNQFFVSGTDGTFLGEKGRKCPITGRGCVTVRILVCIWWNLVRNLLLRDSVFGSPGKRMAGFFNGLYNLHLSAVTVARLCNTYFSAVMNVSSGCSSEISS
jgi:hypothetical protein